MFSQNDMKLILVIHLGTPASCLNNIQDCHSFGPPRYSSPTTPYLLLGHTLWDFFWTVYVSPSASTAFTASGSPSVSCSTPSASTASSLSPSVSLLYLYHLLFLVLLHHVHDKHQYQISRFRRKQTNKIESIYRKCSRKFQYQMSQCLPPKCLNMY